MRRLAIAVVACRATLIVSVLIGCQQKRQPTQLASDALAILCGSHGRPNWSKLAPAERDQARDRWLDAEVSNPEVRKFAGDLVGYDPWTAAATIRERAGIANAPSCHPLVLIGTRARTADIELPELVDPEGTDAAADDGNVAVVAELRRGPPQSFMKMRARGVIVVVADRALTLHDVLAHVDELRRDGLETLELVVLAKAEARIVTFRFSSIQSATPLLGVANTGLTLDAAPITDAALRTTKLDPVAAIVEMNVTVQRLAEVLALVGGHAILVPPPQVVAPPAR